MTQTLSQVTSGLNTLYTEVKGVDAAVLQRNVSRLSQEDRKIVRTALAIMGGNAQQVTPEALRQFEQNTERLKQIAPTLKKPDEFSWGEAICNFFNAIRVCFSKNYLKSSSLAADIVSCQAQTSHPTLQKRYPHKHDRALGSVQNTLKNLESNAKLAERAAFTEICTQESEMIYDTDSSGTQLPTGNYTDACYEKDDPKPYIAQMREEITTLRLQIQNPAFSESERDSLEALCNKYETFLKQHEGTLKTESRSEQFKSSFGDLTRENGQIKQAIAQHQKQLTIEALQTKLPNLEGAEKARAEFDLAFLQ